MRFLQSSFYLNLRPSTLKITFSHPAASSFDCSPYSSPMASSSQSISHKRPLPCSSSSSEEEVVSSIQVSQFYSDSQYEVFMNCCASREVLFERLFDEEFLREIKFPWLERLIDWGWWDFMSLHKYVYPNAVRVFYFRGDNRKYNKEGDLKTSAEYDDKFVTYVLGERLEIDADNLRDYISKRLVSNGDKIIPSDFPMIGACRVIFKDLTLNHVEVGISKMDLNTRILHLMVCQTIYPRGGDFATLTKLDIYFMAKIMENDPPDLAALIVRRMLKNVKASKKAGNSSCLPYGKLVSKICLHRCFIPKEEITVKMGKLSIFNEKSLAPMGWVQSPLTKEWYKKKGKEPISEEEASSDKAMDEVTSSLSVILTKLEVMEERQQALENQILHINNFLIAIREQAPFDQPFPIFDPPPF